MAKDTPIQWCDSTINPTMGCDGCELWSKHKKTCYAGILHTRFGGRSKGYAPSFDEVTMFPGLMKDAARWPDLTGQPRREKPWLDGMPRTIFVSDMSDALSKAVTFEYLEEEVITNVTSDLGQRHQWLWLTKRPDRMAKFSEYLVDRETPWPPNLWAGTSVTDQKSVSRIPKLLQVGDETTLHFLSVEPQVEDIDLERWLPRLDWVIHGGQSSHGAREFDINWAQQLITSCRKHKVPYFLKQLGAVVTNKGKLLLFEDAHANDWKQWPKGLRVRQVPTHRYVVSEDDEEISAGSYLKFIIARLRKFDGVIETEQLARDVFDAFYQDMTGADLQCLKGRKTPKWKNMVDWAKAVGASKEILATIKLEKLRYVVLLDPEVTDANWIALAAEQSRKRGSGFRKQCPSCSRYQRLSDEVCQLCGADMPVSKKRRVKVPQ